jgi:hypothetical protein
MQGGGLSSEILLLLLLPSLFYKLVSVHLLLSPTIMGPQPLPLLSSTAHHPFSLLNMPSHTIVDSIEQQGYKAQQQEVS